MGLLIGYWEKKTMLCTFQMALVQGIKTKQSATADLCNIVLASKSTQKYQEIYRLICQLAVMAAASSKTEMTPIGQVFP